MATPWIPQEVKREAIDNTAKIADMCNVEIEFGGMHYPVYSDRDPEEVVTEICRNNWKAKVPHGKYTEYAERFKAETKDLKTTNYLKYLLIIYDLVNWCVRNNIWQSHIWLDYPYWFSSIPQRIFGIGMSKGQCTLALLYVSKLCCIVC